MKKTLLNVLTQKALLLNNVVIIASLLCIQITTGCYLNANISDLNPKDNNIPTPPRVKIDSTKASEFISGSGQYQNTLINRYKILSSAGSYHPELISRTPKGYIVYSSVQGTLISSQKRMQ